MSLLLQVSDPHFGTERPEVVDALLRLAHRETPDVLVLSGDLTQRASADQFAAARALADRLAIGSVVAIPGNHDIPLYDLRLRAFAPYSRFEKAFGRDLEPGWSSPRLLIVTVNTTRPWRHTDGEVSAQQIARVARRLEEAGAEQLRVVVTHQPIAVLRRSDEHDLLHGHADAIRQWSAAGADLILGGHIHLPYIVRLNESSGASRPMWAVQAGTAVSNRLRHEAGNSVNMVRQGRAAAPRCCDIERWDYVAASDEFERVGVETADFRPKSDLPSPLLSPSQAR